ncbi:MAG TPA: cephalosporin hydroxylase family protein [Gemmatales bacterium]|nr:cephalosporin hydroxylase family protein [Gemmatales bacterium]
MAASSPPPIVGIPPVQNAPAFQALSRDWLAASGADKYSYRFTWLGRPIIQYPQDIVAMQELLWQVRPDLVIETGVAHGGSLILYASILELIGGPGLVVGVDIDIRPHNREAIEDHPLGHRIELIQGSSTAAETLDAVRAMIDGKQTVLVVLDSNHTHDHVLDELRLYAPLVTPGSYLVVFDTAVEHLPAEACADRPWGPGNNPLTAVRQFLNETSDFVVDAEIEDRLLVTVAPSGYLRCVRSPAGTEQGGEA